MSLWFRATDCWLRIRASIGETSVEVNPDEHADFIWHTLMKLADTPRPKRQTA